MNPKHVQSARGKGVCSNDAAFGESKMEEVIAKLTLVRRRVISPCWLPGGGGGGGDVAASATPRE